MLMASGELDLTAGGAPQDATTSLRRTIYTIKRRNNQNDLLYSLDAPAGFTSTAERQNTSTATQALMFMNGDWVVARARRLAARVPTVEAAWEAVLSREPSPAEARQAREFLARRSGAASPPPSPPRAPVGAAGAAVGRFRENSAQERVIARSAEREGDDFTVAAVVRLESVDAGAAVRTIASRWNGEKNSLDAHGWSLGVTGRKSAYKPLNLILQLVGEDENMNTSYEVVPSDLRLQLGTTYHVAARVSCSEHTVTFTVQDMNQPLGERRTATVKHGILGKLGTGQATPVIGGTARRNGHLFDGVIEGVHVAAGILPDGALAADPAQWAGGTLTWLARRGGGTGKFEVSGGAATAESSDPRQRAMADLCHVLLNSNEFLYLH
jgi:hypothetical protein